MRIKFDGRQSPRAVRPASEMQTPNFSDVTEFSHSSGRWLRHGKTVRAIHFNTIMLSKQIYRKHMKVRKFNGARVATENRRKRSFPVSFVDMERITFTSKPIPRTSTTENC